MPLNLGQRLGQAAQKDAPATNELSSAVLSIRGHYDFSIDGGAVGNISLTENEAIPDGAVVVGGFINVTETVTGGAGSTLAISVESAGDVLTAEAVASFSAGLYNVLPAPTSGDLTAGDGILTTAARDIVLAVGTDPLTNGTFDIVLFVIPPA